MVVYFGLGYSCAKELLSTQCRRLFITQNLVVRNEIVDLVSTVLNSNRHWCDREIYEIVVGALVDITES